MDPLTLDIVKPYVKPKPKIVTGADPAAGQEFSVTVPTGEVWEVLSLEATLVTNATAASRYVQIIIDNGTTEFARVGSPVAQAASQTILYTASPLVGAMPSSAPSNAMVMNLPVQLLLPGYRVRSVTASLQTGDNWGAPVLYVVKYEAF
jgi:hypothetical protein